MKKYNVGDLVTLKGVDVANVTKLYIGTVVYVYKNNDVYEVEFMVNGSSVVKTVSIDQIDSKSIINLKVIYHKDFDMYNVGDHVILNDDVMDEHFGVIIEKESPYFYIKILFSKNKNPMKSIDDIHTWHYFAKIKRKMTKEEISELDIMLNVNKFNL